ncbi:hypothetical protein BDV95DRAFT_379121 [Massariosphaeria phaeospora]|uniref:MARVEL domain-containing protein n=1 Tax=Massariosphaeria phaeospora TaxID=100035 RepID=A0A7C8I8X2_9PLEO|nr:hypothetical protein BDV95DRAFT_379121 [Massariosphaeria phaeospora]
MSSTMDRALGRQMLRSAGIFQAAAALPVTLCLGFFAFVSLFEAYNINFYDFFSCSITALMAAGIMFVVVVQRKSTETNYRAFIFESVKSGLATGLWLWLMLDSGYGPWRHRYAHSDRDVEMRVARSATAGILLLVLFYPAWVYTFALWNQGDEEHGIENEENGQSHDAENPERRPLLRRG